MIISRAPVRLSMGGGGTDLPSYYEKHGGFLMAAAINKYIYVHLNKRFYNSIRLSYSQTEILYDIEKIEHPIFREALRLTGIDKQVELVSISDTPAHCGLGTSSTFTVALLNALYNYKKEHLTVGVLAETAYNLERNILKRPVGKQDHYAAAYGGFRGYWFNPGGTVHVEPINIREEKLMELQNNILLFHLGKERPSSTILEGQDKKSQENDEGTIQRLHKIKEIGFRTKKIFESGDIDEFGELLHEHWLTKKGLSQGISDAFADEVYDTARKNGALGGKIVGAGGGGFMLLYCPKDRSKLIAAMETLKLKPFWFQFDHEGSQIIFHS